MLSLPTLILLLIYCYSSRHQATIMKVLIFALKLFKCMCRAFLFVFRWQQHDLQLTQFYGYVMIGFVKTTNLSPLKIVQLQSKTKQTLDCFFYNFKINNDSHLPLLFDGVLNENIFCLVYFQTLLIFLVAFMVLDVECLNSSTRTQIENQHNQERQRVSSDLLK